jgi:hypothetical protein
MQAQKFNAVQGLALELVLRCARLTECVMNIAIERRQHGLPRQLVARGVNRLPGGVSLAVRSANPIPSEQQHVRTDGSSGTEPDIYSDATKRHASPLRPVLRDATQQHQAARNQGKGDASASGRAIVARSPSPT